MSPGATPFELTAPVKQTLQRLQLAWQLWVQGYYAADRDQAETALSEIGELRSYLGMESLPDLSIAAAIYAVRSAREGDEERADWALEAAERLDGRRPEVHFAAATVRRLEKSYPMAAWELLQGYVSLFRLPQERSLWLHGALLWLLYVVLVSGSLFIALLMAVKGRDIFRGLSDRLSPPLPLPAVWIVAVAGLLWPLVLPAGLAWLVIYWSVLLWGLASTSERTILVMLWLVAGAIPLITAQQRGRVEVEMMPAMRAIQGVSEGALYGELFRDLSQLPGQVAEQGAVSELLADTHRSLGQWELARRLYLEVLKEEPNNASALVNLGVDAQRQRDYPNAIEYFRRATQADDQSAAGFFDLSLAYSRSLQFEASQDAFRRAKELDGARVDVWQEQQATSNDTVPVDGGRARTQELHRSLGAVVDGSLPSWKERLLEERSLWLAGALLLIALLVYRLMSLLGVSRRPPFAGGPSQYGHGWIHDWLPGLASAERGHGVRAFAGVFFPAALLMLPLLRSLGYRVPLGYEPERWLLFLLMVIGMMVVILAKLRSKAL